MSDVNKIRNEVNKAKSEVSGVKEINYHKYNDFIMNKTLEFNKTMKETKDRDAARITEDSAKEATEQFKTIQSGKSSFLFSGLDKFK